MKKPPPNFQSFIMAGFECTYALTNNGKRYDLLAASKHDEYIRLDYELIKEQGIGTVREGLSWSQIDQGHGVYDFSRFEAMMKVGRKLQIEQLWDLNHFDYPEYLDPFTDQFVEAYAEYAAQAWKVIKKYHPQAIYLNPMNEPSFFAWMCDQGLWAPFKKGQGTTFKKQLIKAAIAAMKKVLAYDSQALFIHTDPYMYRVPMHAKNNQAEIKFCHHFNQKVRFHAWDMMSGKTNPELGGDPKYLHVLGINYYFYNQQMVGKDSAGKLSFQTLPLNHKKRLPLSTILTEVYQRYQTPMIIAETGSYRKRREQWWRYILHQIDSALELKKPVFGVCSYPTLDISKGAGFIVPESGLWDFDIKDKTYQRIPHQQALDVIRQYGQKWATESELKNSTELLH